jgi:hypothetical protein
LGSDGERSKWNESLVMMSCDADGGGDKTPRDESSLARRTVLMKRNLLPMTQK